MFFLRKNMCCSLKEISKKNYSCCFQKTLFFLRKKTRVFLKKQHVFSLKKFSHVFINFLVSVLKEVISEGFHLPWLTILASGLDPTKFLLGFSQGFISFYQAFVFSPRFLLFCLISSHGGVRPPCSGVKSQKICKGRIFANLRYIWREFWEIRPLQNPKKK